MVVFLLLSYVMGLQVDRGSLRTTEYTSMRERTYLAVMEHIKIVGQKLARDTERWKIKTTTVMKQITSLFSLQILKTQYKDMSTEIPCKGLLLTRMICQSHWAGGGLQSTLR